MKSIALGFVLVGMASGLGCVHMQPVGPFANSLRSPTGPAPRGNAESTSAKVPALPVLQPPPAPVPPALLVTPGEVTEANHQQSARRLVDEMEADRKAMETMPRYAEVSVIKAR